MGPDNNIDILQDAWSTIWTDFAMPSPVGAFDTAVRHYRVRKGYHAALVRFLILATRHNDIPTEPDAQLVVDIDLSILGSERNVYDTYAEGVRYEYRHVPGPLYRRGRAKVQEEFLSRKHVFQTAAFMQRYEIRARENLQRELEPLS